MRAFGPLKPDPPPARRRFGQNFLANPAAVSRIVAAVHPAPGEPLLEIGPGRGALTGPLLREAGRIAAVELDRDLAAALRERYPADRLLLFERDVLRLPLEEVARALGLPARAPIVVAGNLPYNISKPVAAMLVRERATVSRAILMFQREVADRLTALPGTREYGPLTVLVGRAFRVSALFDLAPSSFRPRPAVVSTVTRWERRDPEDLPPALEAPLRDCLRACFARRRQTLLNNLRAALPGGAEEARALLALAGLSPGSRAETVCPEAFLALARSWPEQGAPGGAAARREGPTPLLY
jgi:16S rRNA (adenine1518-N6/adenine1519-N6)-dimethyltransferase